MPPSESWWHCSAFFLLGKRRRIALENIEIAFGSSLSAQQKNALARQSFRNTAVSLVELFLIPKIRKHAPDHFTIVGHHYLDGAFAKGKGVVLVISHLGSWEYLSFLPHLTENRWSVVVKSVKNPYLDRRIDALRKEISVHPINKTGSIRKVLTELKQNHGVAVLIDQWDGPDGMWVEFFGRATSTTSIPSRLAKKTGCALVPAYCLRRRPGHYEIHICPPYMADAHGGKSEEEMTLELNQLLEGQIRQWPEQWLWGHRRWKARPTSRRRSERCATD
jgi:KDO2-lipid IV(A) lauroyltransferase